MTVALVAVSAVAALALVGAVYQAIGGARDARRLPPPGRLVDVGGHRLHAVCLGSGSPPVVFESGVAASSLSWARVQPEVASFTTACAYDRAGLAWSDASRAPRTLDRIVDELHALLTRLPLAAPVVLVGHSFGVFVCLQYTVRHPGDVAGLVLVDPPSEWAQSDRRRARLLRGGVLMSRLGALLARIGVVRASLALLTGGAPGAPRHFVKMFGPTTARTLEHLVGEVRKLPPETHPAVRALWCRPKCFRAMADHIGAVADAARATIGIASLGGVPLTVISSGEQTAEVDAAHEALARLSSRGRRLIAARSGHWIQFDEPDVILEAVREIVAGGRSADLPAGSVS